MLAAILESGDLARLYTGLSLLVSAAAEGTPARALVSFGALEVLLDDALEDRALDAGATPALSEQGRPVFAKTLAELRQMAAELDECRLYACAAAVEATGADPAAVERHLDGVTSTTRFLRDVAGASLVVV